MRRLAMLTGMVLVVTALVVPGASAAAAAPARGTINTVPGSGLVDGQTFTIDDGAGGHVVFEFDVRGDGGSAANEQVAVQSGDTAAVVKSKVVAAVNGVSGLAVTAASAGYAAVSLVNDVAGAAGNVPLDESVSDAGFTVIGMSGGTDDGSVPWTAAPATGTINTVPRSGLVDGQTFTIDDGAGGPVVFEFDVAGDGVSASDVQVGVHSVTTAAEVKSKVVDAVNGASGLAVTAASAGYAAVSLVNDVAAAAGNTALSESVSDPGFTVIGMAGGRDADNTPPSASPAVTSGTPGANGWYTSDVTVAWNWSDSGAGIDPARCNQTSVSSGEGPSVTVSAGCYDLAGNLGSGDQAFAIDESAPAVAVTGVTDGARYPLGAVPVAGCSTSDAVSGVDTAASVSVTTTGSGGVGPFTATCSGARDVAGNGSAAVRAGYTVVYGFTGFLQPVDNPPVVNVTAAGKAIPVRFRLGGNHGLSVLAAGYPQSQSMACSFTARRDPIEQTVSARSSSLTYDSAKGWYVYVWKTNAAWKNTCRRLDVRLADGTDHIAYVKLT